MVIICNRFIYFYYIVEELNFFEDIEMEFIKEEVILMVLEEEDEITAMIFDFLFK